MLIHVGSIDFVGSSYWSVDVECCGLATAVEGGTQHAGDETSMACYKLRAVSSPFV